MILSAYFRKKEKGQRFCSPGPKTGLEGDLGETTDNQKGDKDVALNEYEGEEFSPREVLERVWGQDDGQYCQHFGKSKSGTLFYTIALSFPKLKYRMNANVIPSDGKCSAHIGRNSVNSY